MRTRRRQSGTENLEYGVSFYFLSLAHFEIEFFGLHNVIHIEFLHTEMKFPGGSNLARKSVLPGGQRGVKRLLSVPNFV